MWTRWRVQLFGWGMAQLGLRLLHFYSKESGFNTNPDSFNEKKN